MEYTGSTKMFFKQYFLGCLAHASYMIADGNSACVVDPQRDVDLYIEEAKKRGFQIDYVVETHLHADFVSGHQELARKTGAKVVFSDRAAVEFEHLKVKEGDEIKVGGVRLQFLETPGHTPESISILVFDADADRPSKVLTGDTLFIGDVGRPDLIMDSNLDCREMASMLYDSLHEKLLKLSDDVEVYPAHGAGSLCGKHLSKERSSTIGEQRRDNRALKPMSREEFIDMLTLDLPEVPAYFVSTVETNRVGARSLEDLNIPEALTPAEVQRRALEGRLVVDVRSAALFGASHIPGSFNLSLGGQFASWAGSIVELGTPMILVAEDRESVMEAVVRLARAGHETVEGYLDGGIFAWSKAGLDTGETPQITVTKLKERLEEGYSYRVIDVRRPYEYREGHIPGAINVPLDCLSNEASKISTETPIAVVCEGGYRSSIASCMLRSNGHTYITNVIGGTGAWRNAGLALETETLEAATV